ncbi:MAG: hypothetical protein A2Z18_07935 [Armatimonadetes bacterium RBG_16_58_9]|nr:MAG: hypothetical protein A2Z18_07935 [Armatimonadetes bacterium RBG_16_58_9]
MRLMLGIVVIVVISAVLSGCAKREAPSPVTEQGDVIADRDFVAKIRKTKDPYVFEISIEKVNKNPNAGISGFPATVDLILKDSSGKVFASKNWEKQQYAKEIGDAFSTARPVSVEPLTGKVRLVKNDLPPGKYTVQPRVRIRQVWTITDYPAGNSVQVEIR